MSELDTQGKKLVGEALRTARIIAKLSYRKLAALSGITAPAIAKIENGVHWPTMDTIRKLRRHIVIDINKLFDLAESATANKVVDDR